MTRRLRLLTAASLLAMLVAAGMIFVYAPTDLLQGPVQKIFYVHVSSAIASFACFGLVVAGSVAYLWKGSLRGDRLARSAAGGGLVLITITIVMGIVWAKPVWNWDPTQTWDARFTSTVVLWAVYAGYLLVRKFAEPGRQAARLAAVVGIVGFVDVPVVYGSVYWWRTLHPGPVIGVAGALEPKMLVTWLVTMACELLLAGTLVALRYRLEWLRDQREERTAQFQLTPVELAR